jgi:predicted transcriptional regulator
VTVPSHLSLGGFMDDVVWSHRYTTYPVVDDRRALGLLHFRRLAEVPREEWDERTVGESMLPLDSVPRLHAGDELVDALATLGESDVGRGLVLENGDLVGLLSITDLARALEVGRKRRPVA